MPTDQARPTPQAGGPAAQQVSVHTTARDALSLLLSSRALYLPVVNDDGSRRGLLTVELLHRTLASDGHGRGPRGSRPEPGHAAAGAAEQQPAVRSESR